QTANPAEHFGAPALFTGPGCPDPAAAWRIENVYPSNLTAAPTSAAARMQFATEFHAQGQSTPSRMYTRYSEGTTATSWVQSGSNLTNVPNWEAAVVGDMVHDTSVANKFVAPVNVKQYTDARLGTFINRFTATASPPGDPLNARVG